MIGVKLRAAHARNLGLIVGSAHRIEQVGLARVGYGWLRLVTVGEGGAVRGGLVRWVVRGKGGEGRRGVARLDEVVRGGR